MARKESLLLEKPLPSLKQWLGDGVRADGFEEWVAENLRVQSLELSEDEKSSLRMLQTMLIAMVEAGRRETVEHGRDYAMTVGLMARVAGGACMAAMMSVTKEGTPYMRLAKVLADDFATGAKAMVKGAIKEAAERD